MCPSGIPIELALLSLLGWKLLSCSQCQELGQRATLAPDWLPENKEPIRSQAQLFDPTLDLTTTQKFPPQMPGMKWIPDEMVRANKNLQERVGF